MFLLTGPVLYGARAALHSRAPACARRPRQPPEARWPLGALSRLTQRLLRPRRQRAAARAGPLPRRAPHGRTRGRHPALVRSASPAWAPSASRCHEAHAAPLRRPLGGLAYIAHSGAPKGAPRPRRVRRQRLAPHAVASHSPSLTRPARCVCAPQRTSSSRPPDRSRTARRRRCGASCTPSRAPRRATAGYGARLGFSACCVAMC